MNISHRLIAALMVAMLFTAPALASVVTFQLKVDGSGDPVTINLGDSVEVQLWASVTDNVHNDTALGLAGFTLDLHSSSDDVLAAPAPGNASLWDGTYHTPSAWFSINAGILSGDRRKVEQHSAGQVIATAPSDFAAETMTLISSGWFEGASLGQADLTLDMLPSYVIWVGDPEANNFAAPAGTVNLGAPLTVHVVPEPAATALLLGLLPLLRRHRRRAPAAA